MRSDLNAHCDLCDRPHCSVPMSLSVLPSSLSSFLDCLPSSVRVTSLLPQGSRPDSLCDYHSDWIFPSQTAQGSLLTDAQPPAHFLTLGSAHSVNSITAARSWPAL